MSDQVIPTVGEEPAVSAAQPTATAPAPVTPPPAMLTPTQLVVKSADHVEYVTDATGRKLGVKRNSASIKRRVMALMPGAQADKGFLISRLWMAACCVNISGEEITFPNSELALNFLHDRLDDYGIEAIAEAQSLFTSGGDLKKQ